ncbi:unnamed protein product [Ixodes pacificus]
MLYEYVVVIRNHKKLKLFNDVYGKSPWCIFLVLVFPDKVMRLLFLNCLSSHTCRFIEQHL